MPASLDTIVAAVRQRISLDRRSADLGALERTASQHTPRGFRKQLHRTSQSGIAIIAELKKASPSKGLIRADFRPTELAKELEHAGAAALSILTDEEFFQGSLANLRQASAACTIPCLRKDFILDEFQILEARAHGADAILLIVAALDQSDLRSLAQTARDHGLDVLCEAHDELELERALDAGCDLIGINSRNLRTFEVDLATPFHLAEKMPAGCLRVAESGIRSGADIANLRAAGYDAFLVGESLMKAQHPGEALTKLLEEATPWVNSQPVTGKDQKLATSNKQPPL
jgi:indole-3-glycerol phosphate synthase